MVAGDFNAKVASAKGEDAAVGKYANKVGNARGHTMHHWVNKEHLVIANTIFKKRAGKIWSHKVTQTGRKRLIDYICIDRSLRREILDGHATNELDLGSDHRAIHVKLRCKMPKRRRPWKPPKGNNVGWKPVDKKQYHQLLDEAVKPI